METIKLLINVIDNIVTTKTENMIAGSVGDNEVTEIIVTVPDVGVWEGLHLGIHFKSPKGERPDEMNLGVDNNIKIPGTVLDAAGELKFSIVGRNLAGTEVIHTNDKIMKVLAALSDYGHTTPAAYDTIVTDALSATAASIAQTGLCEAATGAANEIVETAQNKLDNGEFVGAPGYTPQKGVDYNDGAKGDPGPNSISASTATNITGLIAGNGTNVSAPTAAQVGALPIPDAVGHFADKTINGALQETNNKLSDIPKRGKKIVMIGDSITNGTSATLAQMWYWLDIFTNNNHTIYNKGVGGNTTTQMLSRFAADVVSLSPDIVIINGGKNNISSPETVISDIKKMVALSEIAGIEPILSSVIQYGSISGGTVYSDTSKGYTVAVNNLIKDYAAASDIKFVDFYSALIDPQTGYTANRYINASDNVHPTLLGVVKMVEILLPLFYRGSIDDVQYLPAGNLISNAGFTADANGDGVPDSWSKTSDGAAQGTCQILPTKKGNCIKLSMTSNPANNFSIKTSCSVNEGDVLEFSADIMTQDIVGDLAINYEYCGAKVYFFDVVTYDEKTLIYNWKTPIGKWIRIKKEFTVAAGVTTMYVVFTIRYSKSGDLYVRRPLLKKIN